MPLLAGIPIIGSMITGIGALSTMIATYIAMRLSTKFFFLGSQIFVSFLLITIHLVMLGFFVYAIMFIYNQYNNFLALLSTFENNSEILSIAFHVMQTLGVVDAFSDVFTVFSPYILGYLGYRSTMIAYHSLEHTSNELFKIGVLVQQ